MNCKECRDVIPLLPGGEVPPEVEAEARAHTATCAACRKEEEAYASLAGMLRSMKDMDDVDFNWERFAAVTCESAMKKRRRFPSSPAGWRRTVFIATAAALFLAAALFFTAGMSAGVRLKREVRSAGETACVSAGRHGEPLREVSPRELESFLAEEEGAGDFPVFPSGRESSLAGEETKGPIRRAWLGLQVRDLPYGYVVVERIIQGGPSASSGLRPGDVIVACGRIRVRKVRELERALAPCAPGEKVTLVIIRGGKRRTVTLTAGEVPHHL